jgi:hypothetical protein
LYATLLPQKQSRLHNFNNNLGKNEVWNLRNNAIEKITNKTKEDNKNNVL